MTFHLDEARELLRRTPVTLRDLLSDLSEPWLSCNEGPETWSPRDVVAHLADLEATEWVGRARIILEFGERKPFDPVDRFRFREHFYGKSVRELLDLFAQRRQENLDTMGTLGIDDTSLRRSGRHPSFGTVTLQQLLATWVVHDLAHVGQIVRVLAKRYDTAVGPWREFLPILAPTRRGSPAS